MQVSLAGSRKWRVSGGQGDVVPPRQKIMLSASCLDAQCQLEFGEPVPGALPFAALCRIKAERLNSEWKPATLCSLSKY